MKSVLHKYTTRPSCIKKLLYNNEKGTFWSLAEQVIVIMKSVALILN